MKNGVHFSRKITKSKIRLFSIGRGFIPAKELAVLSDSRECAKIEDVQKQFRRRVLKKQAGAGERKSRDERSFVNKTRFILLHEHKASWEHLLPDLLADQTTLFSRSYQVYATDHPVYLKLRGQSETQLHVCLDEALVNVPCEEKGRYKTILNRIAEKAAQEKKPLYKVELEMMDAVVDGKVNGQVLEEFLCWAEKNVKAEDVLDTGKELFPDWKMTQQEVEYLLRGCLQKDSRTGPGIYRVYRKVCTYYTPVGVKRAMDWLKGWIPGLELREEEAQFFFSCVLEVFFYRIRSMPLEKEAVRHHAARFFVYDKTACEAYLKRKKRLQKVLEQYQEWKKQDEMSAFPLSQDSVVDSTCYYAKEQKPSIPVEEIIKATKDYLLNTRGGAKHFSDILAKTVVIETVSNSNNLAQFPIRYLMICVAGSSQLFSTPRVLTAQALSDVLKSPYYQKPTKWKQRICRISFLHQLHEICGLKKEERSESWKCFLQIHGSVIQSSEEDDLWREVIYGAEQDFHNPKEEIAPIELNLLCNECLQTCLPIQPERLYGYQGGSTLHRGGFAKFLKGYPDVCYLRLWKKSDCSQNDGKMFRNST